MRLSVIVSTALLVPALVWLVIGTYALLHNGFYSYSSLFPLPFKMHSLSLLNVSIFYLVTFLGVTPREPMRNFLIVCSMLFLFNAVYELVFAVFYDSRGLIVALPLALGGGLLVLLLNRKFKFLTRDKTKISLAVLCFSCFLALMLTLYESGFFEHLRLYLSGHTAIDPHNPLWILSKIIALWMLFPLLNLSKAGEREKATDT